MDNFLVEKLKLYWLPILLGIAGMIFLGYGLISLSASKEEKQDMVFESSEENKTESLITVDIEGAVQKPGVYELPADARVQDGLIAAGGMSPEADREKISKGLNLAAKLTDGAKIYIPFIGDTSSTSNIASSGQTVLGADSSQSTININTASASELDKLQGVGQVTAEKIIAGRPYAAIEELVSKKIVGQKVYEQIKSKISVY